MPGKQRIVPTLLILLVWTFIPAGLAADGPDPAESPEPEAARPPLGAQAPTYEAPDLFGQPVDVPRLIKGKVTLVAFWASWCQPCINEIPTLRNLARTYRRRGLVVVGVGVMHGGDTAEKQRQAAARQLVNYQLIFDHEGEYQDAYRLDAVPYSVLLGPDGRISWQGRLLPDDLEEKIRMLIVESRRKGSPQG
jgi:peroxiredoxin